MVFICFYLSRSEAGVLVIRRGHTLNKYCVTVYGSILLFSLFKVIALSDALGSSHFRR